MDRVIVYIDGFNLYFGIIDRGWHRYLWLDLPALSKRLLKPKQSLIATRYFTARVRADKAKISRQSTYLQAMETLGGVDIHYGRYQKKTKQCYKCRYIWDEYQEKMSDVRIASELLRDAFNNSFDTALIVSADADLQPPIEVINQEFPNKHVVVAFPPRRDSHHLRSIANDYFRIGRGRLSKCQLPANITKPDGYVLTRPTKWS